MRFTKFSGILRYLITVTRPDLVIVTPRLPRHKKRTCQLLNFVISADHRAKIEENGKTRGKYLPAIGLICRVFTNGPGDWGSISHRVIPKTQKMVLDAALLSTQHYKVRIKGKVEQSKELSRALPYTLVANFTFT